MGPMMKQSKWKPSPPSSAMVHAQHWMANPKCFSSKLAEDPKKIWLKWKVIARQFLCPFHNSRRVPTSSSATLPPLGTKATANQSMVHGSSVPFFRFSKIMPPQNTSWTLCCGSITKLLPSTATKGTSRCRQKSACSPRRCSSMYLVSRDYRHKVL